MANIKRKKWIWILSVVIILLIAAYFLVPRVIMPHIISSMLTSDSPPPGILPDKLERVVATSKVQINEEIDIIPEYLHALNLTFDDLLVIVEQTDADQVKRGVERLLVTDLQSTDQVFEIMASEVDLPPGYQVESFRPIFMQRVRMDQVHRGLNAIRSNDLMNTIPVPVARNTARQILLDHRSERIEQELAELKEN